jgi:asparagine synthase (glutamine-hydrolysing)
MTQSLAHRGPDDEGIYLDASIGMGFRRLSILDLSQAGHQPMISNDGNCILVFNGEIYNYVEIRAELERLGHQFRSTGDSEVLLEAYRQWGTECLHRLNGMWAFIVYDRKRNCLFGSRDRFGVKPLYYRNGNDAVLFASEIKAIRASGYYQDEVNWPIAAGFLLEGRLDEHVETFYEGIEQIPPGSAFELNREGVWRRWSFWSLNDLGCTGIHDPPSQFAELFEDSVRLRMRSDVPVGVCLSGGLDSTSIMCAAARHRGDSTLGSQEPLLAFCYMAKEYDESVYIADTLAQTGAVLKQLQTSPLEVWNDLKTMLWYQDEPVHTMTPIVGYQLMRLAASQGIRVILNGQGADETIGGYSSYFLDGWVFLLRSGKIAEAWDAIKAFAAAHGGRPRSLFADTFSRLIAWEMYRFETYREWARSKRRARARNNSWFSQELTQHLTVDDLSINDGTLNSVLKQSVNTAPLPLYLRIEDRNSMAHSVEARLPFLDYRLVSYVFNLPDEWKVRGPWNKYILREAMRGRIPESVRTRVEKMGFPTPSGRWLAHDLFEPVQDLLSSRAVKERGIYHYSALLSALSRHRKGETEAANRLFHVVQFELLADMMRKEPIPVS